MQFEPISAVQRDIRSLLHLENVEDSIEVLSISNIQSPPPAPGDEQALMDDCLLPCSFPHTHRPSQEQLQPQHPKNHKKGNENTGAKRKRVKKRTKSRFDDNSPFHNCQKHLMVALKRLIIFPEGEEGPLRQAEPWRQAARQIWGVFQQSVLQSKKILHFVFNEQNELPNCEQDLRAFGLLSTYLRHGEETYNAGKNYLSRLAIDQIDSQSVEDYVRSSKVRDKSTFQDYILRFRRQLELGFIKKRLVID